MSYEHLRLGRETPLTERHARRFHPTPPPADPRGHGSALLQKLRHMQQDVASGEIGGFDDRKLLKLRLRAGESLLNFENIPGIEIVSQEDKEIVITFASIEALQEIESRLATLARDGVVTRKELLFAIESFEHWTQEERTGPALREQNFPDTAEFVLDIELWPQDRQDNRDALLLAFHLWLQEQQITRLDSIKQPSLLMVRVRCTLPHAQLLLRHRDVRQVDLPPRQGISVEILMTGINEIPPIAQLSEDAPTIAVLDSGLTTGHPLVAAVIGDAQGYIPPARSPDDTSPWHGTFVAGLALYGDVEACIRSGQFLPCLRLVSGKVFNDDGSDHTVFVEKAVEEAVRHLHDQYGCRVFNLSYGDLNKIYDGRHVRGLAYMLDLLTRELGVLFVIPTGNLQPSDLPPDPLADYPHYLLAPSSRLLDPGTALNAITVGGLSEHEATRQTQRHPDTIEDRPIARSGQPFPLTRCGPSINAAIKPDFVEHAGNVAVMRAGGRNRHSGLGVISLNGGFTAGQAFSEDIGTSYAAPAVAHKAAKLLIEQPDASANLLRTLLGAHAEWPTASSDLFNVQTTEGRNRALQIVGYGQIDDTALYRSLDSTVTLLSEDQIGNNQHHFYELPLPISFWEGDRRYRTVAVALAYSPVVRTTRLDYRMSKISFNLVTAESLDQVTEAFRRNRENGIPERAYGRWIPNDTRKAGTLQVSRWAFKQAIADNMKVFVVITRQDSPWSNAVDIAEPYALTVAIADRELTDVDLYAAVKAELDGRARAEVRARF